jgi:hypothetical protein
VWAFPTLTSPFCSRPHSSVQLSSPFFFCKVCDGSYVVRKQLLGRHRPVLSLRWSEHCKAWGPCKSTSTYNIIGQPVPENLWHFPASLCLLQNYLILVRTVLLFSCLWLCFGGDAAR